MVAAGVGAAASWRDDGQDSTKRKREEILKSISEVKAIIPESTESSEGAPHAWSKVRNLVELTEEFFTSKDQHTQDPPTPQAIADDLSPQDKLTLITQNLQEVLRPELLEDIVVKQNRPLKIYWGKHLRSATTGRPHVAYFVPMLKIAHFLRAGCHIKILLADVHGFLDNLKAPIELVNYRAEYYRFCIVTMLRAIGVPVERLEFSLGSSHQLSEKYTMDLFRLSSLVTEHDAKKAGAEVVKQSDNAPLSGFDVLDEEHLGVDAQFGGADQRKIFTFAQEQLPRIGYKDRIHLTNCMVPGLAGGKMSASDPDSKIDLLDTPDAVRRKLKKAFAAPRETVGNGIISFVEYVLLPISSLRLGDKGEFVVERREGEGEPLIYNDIEKLKEDYTADILTPQLLKSGVTAALLALLEPIQAQYQASSEWQDLTIKAYPPPEVKKKKKVKDKGTRRPDPKDVEAMPDGHVEGKDKDQVNLASSAEAAIEQLDIKNK